jgi:hypothetical protein
MHDSKVHSPLTHVHASQTKGTEGSEWSEVTIEGEGSTIRDTIEAYQACRIAIERCASQHQSFYQGTPGRLVAPCLTQLSRCSHAGEIQAIGNARIEQGHEGVTLLQEERTCWQHEQLWWKARCDPDALAVASDPATQRQVLPDNVHRPEFLSCWQQLDRVSGTA